MKRLMVFAFVVVVLFAAATTMLRSHTHATSQAIGSETCQSRAAATDGNKLPIEEFEDQSLVYSTRKQ